jgi:hypothetical protein
MATYSWPIVGSDTDLSDHIVIPWDKSSFPSGASQAVVTTSGIVVFTFNTSTSTPATADNFGLWQWSSIAGGGVVGTGAQVGVGFSMPNDLSTAARVRAMVKVNNKLRFKAMWLELRSDSGSSHSEDKISSLTNGVWTEIAWTMPNVDISSWGSRIHATITAVGTDIAANAGATEFSLGWLAAET